MTPSLTSYFSFETYYDSLYHVSTKKTIFLQEHSKIKGVPFIALIYEWYTFSYLTVIFTFFTNLLPSFILTVIVQLPFPFAVTLPFELTVATLFFDEV